MGASRSVLRSLMFFVVLLGAGVCAAQQAHGAIIVTGTFQLPARAAVFGFPPGGATAQVRYSLSHGPNELPELTGPNDRQLVGDFRGLGHDQVLFLNYWGGARRVVLADFASAGAPVLRSVENWGVSVLLNGWDDADDLALAGDFMHLGYDQVLLIDRDQPEGEAAALVGHLMILDYHGDAPVVRYRETWAQRSDVGWIDPEDVVLAGDFRSLGYDQVLLLNRSKYSGEGRLLVRDYSSGHPVDQYSRSDSQDPDLDTWCDPADRTYAGDFMGLGRDQVLLLNMQWGVGRVRILDFRCGADAPITRYLEAQTDSPLLNGWQDRSDRAFAGDFTGLHRDQMLFMNMSGVQGRVLIADFGLGKPARVRYLEQWGASPVLNGWQDTDDVLLAGRFTTHSTGGLLSFNNIIVSQRIEVTRVHDPALLESTLRSHFTGRVLVPGDAQWDLSGHMEIPLRSGVQLVGERGWLGSRPVLFTDYKGATYPLFRLTGNDVRVEGLHFRGPGHGSQDATQPYTFALAVLEDPLLERGRRVVIADNEFDEWTGSCVDVSSTPPRVFFPNNPSDPAYLEAHTWPHVRPEEAGLVRVERNYFHHNVRQGGGYGVSVYGAHVTVEGNVFDYNRHAVTSSGQAFSGYVARFNYALQGGPTYDGHYTQHFDVHGAIYDSSHWIGGPAGEYYEVAYNAVRGEQDYGFWGSLTRAAFVLRGRPATGASFHDNVVVHDNSGEAIELRGEENDPSLDDDNPATFNLQASGNHYDTDYSTEIATGDFDGDGRTDVFVATGTAWFYSRGGVRPWEFLHASNKRTADLAFADVDNDRITDVLYRDPNGNLGYLKSGTAPLAPLTTLPVAVRDLRSGDFDGDSKTDLFYTLNGQWRIWYGRTRTWTAAQTSSQPLSGLLFGEFDDIRGTDVAGMNSGTWACSSGGTQPWARLSGLSDPLGGAVAADFDGDGRSDIAFNDGAEWRWSRGGRSPLVLLRNDSGMAGYPSLKSLLIGRFDGGARAQAVTFERRLVGWSPPRPPRFVTGERLVIWRGPGTSDAFSLRSGQNMR